MYLHQLKIWNFRKYGTSDGNEINTLNAGLEVCFNKNLNVLVGENDSGKTAIIDAIKQVLLTKSQEYLRIDEKDFYKKRRNEPASKLKIECIFRGFDGEGKEAANFLEWIGFNEDNNYELKVWLHAENVGNRIISEIRAGADDEGAQLDGNARHLLRVTYLKPLRDALAELTPGYKSRFAQILKSHRLFNKGKEKHPLEKIIEKANQGIDNFFKEDRNKSGEEIANAVEIKEAIDSYIVDFFGKERDTTIKISESELSDVLNQLSLTFDENKSGLGSLNLLFIAAELLLLETESSNGLQLALIEEIEAHLHAQAQLRLIESLQRKKEHQFILTTHSITLASKINLENLIICRKGKAFPMGYEQTQLERGDYSFLERFLDATKANLFFAKGVIIVEGDAENLLIPTIAEIIGKPLHQHGVSIVNVGSIAFKRYVKIFLRKDLDDDKFIDEWLNIPIAIITDVDERPIEFYNDLDNKKKNKSIYQVNENNIGELKKITKNINFDKLKKIIYTSETRLQNAVSKAKFDIKKNITKVIRKEIIEAVKLDTITPEIIKSLKESRHAKILEDNKAQNVRAFVTKNWTLEYEFALSNLKKEFYEAVLTAEWIQNNNELRLGDEAIAGINSEVDEFFKDSSAKSKEELAYDIFKPLIRSSNKVSKAITAQCFAEILKKKNENEIKVKLEEEGSPLSYLYNAIVYATTGKL